MEELSKIEADIAKEVINIGLSRSADSLSFFTKGKVLINTVELSQTHCEDLEGKIGSFNTEQLTVLTTELKGELEGVCFLIFDKLETEKLLEVSLPESVLKDPEKKEEMGKAILLEMDNIVTASVITQFADILKCKVYGDVPAIHNVKKENLIPVIKEKSKTTHFIYFNTEFRAEKLEINPIFVWCLNERFIEGVRTIAKNGKEQLK